MVSWSKHTFFFYFCLIGHLHVSQFKTSCMNCFYGVKWNKEKVENITFYSSLNWDTKSGFRNKMFTRSQNWAVWSSLQAGVIQLWSVEATTQLGCTIVFILSDQVPNVFGLFWKQMMIFGLAGRLPNAICFWFGSKYSHTNTHTHILTLTFWHSHTDTHKLTVLTLT